MASPSVADARPYHVRGRVAELRVETLQRALSSPASNSFTLNLFDDARLAVTLERVEDSGHGQQSWTGHIVDRPLSTVVLSLNGDIVSGRVADGATVYAIESVGNGQHRIDQLDAAKLPPFRDGIAVPPTTAADVAAVSDDRAAPTATPSVDVIVYYSPGVVAQSGGLAQVNARIARYIAETNTAFARSAINGRVRLVASAEVPAPDGASDQGLTELLAQHPFVRGQREALGADLVALLSTHFSSNRCGYAYIGPSPEFATSVTSTQDGCDTYYGFAHEIGHNLGGQHAPEDGVVEGPQYPQYPNYARGYKAPDHSFRTVMAYPCTTAPDCPIVLNFSNPNVAAPNGQASGTAARNNARRLNELFAFTAGYRAARVAPSVPFPLQGWVSGDRVNLTWQPPATGGSPSDYLIYAGNAPGASNILNGLSFGDTSLVAAVPPGQYFVRVRARNAGGVSLPSNEAAMSVGLSCALPSAPRNPTHSRVGRTVTINWTPPASGGPVIYTLQAGSFSSGVDILTAPLGGDTGIVTGAPPGTYYVRVIARNACGYGPPSPEITIAVP